MIPESSVDTDTVEQQVTMNNKYRCHCFRLIFGSFLHRYFTLTCDFLPGSFKAVGSLCAGGDNVEVFITRGQHGGSVGATECSHERGALIFTIIDLHTTATAVSDLGICMGIIVDS